MPDRYPRKFKDQPFSESSVSAQLADVRRRFARVHLEIDETLPLSLVDGEKAGADDSDPYNRA